MDNVILRYVFDKKKEADNTKHAGLLQIEVRVQKSNKCVYLSTGYRLFKNQFSKDNGFTCKNHPNASLINNKVRAMYMKVQEFALSDDCKVLSDVRNYDKGKERLYSFPAFMRKELARKDPSYATLEHHNVLIRKIEEYGKLETFGDITYENIVGFDEYLRKTINSPATLNKRHSTLRSYIKEAINMELLTKDPYNLFKMPPKKSKDPIFLDENEINEILKYDPQNDRLQKVKDLFIFQIFTGLAYVDLMGFNRDSIAEMDGYKTIRSSRHKTDESFISLFLPEAERIADKYDYNLPRLSNQKYNDYLKLLGTGVKLKKTLTSHVARHTYATYLLNKGIPIETVSRAMGHSNIKMTQHYAKMLGKKVISDMAVLLKK